MATVFRMDSTNAKPPAWCFHAIFPATIALIGTNPSRLVCFAYWRGEHSGIDVNITESFILRYRPGPDDWIGSTKPAGLRLTCRVQKQPAGTLYKITLTVLLDDVELTNHEWSDIDAGELPYLDSKELHHVITSPTNEHGVHVVN